jgi:hypothetical protein
MAIKQAMAYWATFDTRYADNALSIIEAWANTNTAFGLQKENGELRSTAWLPLLLQMLRPPLTLALPTLQHMSA